MTTRRDVLKVVPAVALGAVVASLPVVAEAKEEFAIYTMVLKLGPDGMKSTWKETAPGSKFFVPDSQLIRLFEEGVDAFWRDLPKGAGLIPYEEVTFRFYKADGTLWGQDHSFEANSIEVIGRGRYAVIDRAFQLLRREIRDARRAHGLPEETDFSGIDHATVQFRYVLPPAQP